MAGSSCSDIYNATPPLPTPRTVAPLPCLRLYAKNLLEVNEAPAAAAAVAADGCCASPSQLSSPRTLNLDFKELC
jgi:hypothetical protein